MGKTTAYIATAVLLAIVAMLPVITFTPERTEEAGLVYYSTDNDTRILLRSDVELLQSQKYFEIPSVPSGPLSTAVAFVLSFVFAFGVFFYSKRKMF
jgi:hypothetical protein